jgi:signal transduction histidine kinase/CheY-like chemotaxis protein
MKILYTNNNGSDILNGLKIKPDNIYLYDIIPQTISLISNDSNNFYKNKHISVEIKNIDNELDICVNSIITSGDIYYIFDIDKNGKINDNDNKKSKNLIAYLSHELRNPIQVISTGIYILSRTIKNIESNNRTISNTCITDKNIPSIINNTDSDEKDLSDSFLSINSIDSIDVINVDTDNMDTFKSVVKRVDYSCKNINIIIDDILDLSKLNNDELVMNIDEHQLLDITNMLYDEYIEEIQKKGLKLHYTTDDNIPEYIYTDDTRIYQILSNLITNAVKYSNTGTIGFNVSYDKNINSVVFQISDQGKGIRKEELDNLFKTYGRTSNSSSDINSTGLGLCICQKIANMLGGTINVNSEYKRGSTFTFTHPIKLNTSKIKIINNIFNNKNIKGSVLIVDDDSNITAMFKLLLKCINYDNGYDIGIDIAHTGNKAIHLTNKKKYNLIFMDIDLDGDDGCVITEFIRSNSTKNKNCHIIAVTANIKAIQETRQDNFNIFDDILLKPFDSNDISQCIIKYL